jgi:hypothetical protein
VPDYGLWPPTRFVRFVRGYDTSVETAQIITDAGPAFIKALGNRGGPHHLACDWVGTQLARWFGLATLEAGILTLTEDDAIPFLRGGRAAPGPAFVTRREDGQTWDGDPASLERIVNPEHVGRLVVFDTWVLNWDRQPPDDSRRPNFDNVFLSFESATAGRFLLKAIDHTHCFGCRAGELTTKVADISQVQDDRIYGLFPGFRPFVTKEAVSAACGSLRGLEREWVTGIVGSIPPAWDVSGAVRGKLAELIVRRAAFVAGTIMGSLGASLWPQPELPF